MFNEILVFSQPCNHTKIWVDLELLPFAAKVCTFLHVKPLKILFASENCHSVLALSDSLLVASNSSAQKVRFGFLEENSFCRREKKDDLTKITDFLCTK